MNKLQKMLSELKDDKKENPKDPKIPKKGKRFKNLKKVILWLFILGSIAALFIFSFFVYFHFKWKSDRYQVLKQAEIYYNQILKETKIYTKYRSIGGKDFQLKNVEEPIRVLDFKGEVLGEFSNERRTFVNIKEISPYFLYALFSTEDADFYQHSGINYKSLLRATVKNILAMRIVEGGSTLTQQLAKLLFTDRKRNFKRKMYEFFCAKELERIYTKSDILLMYVNLIFFGHGAYGVEAASQLFFKKSAKDLKIGEAALLVSVISNPRRYSPFFNRKYSKRKHFAVLKRMSTLGYLDPKSVKKIHYQFWKTHHFLKKELQEGKQVIRKNAAPYVVEEVRRFLVTQYGEDFFIKNKGAVIYTTIDKRLQTYAADELKNRLKYLRKRASWKLRKKGKEQIQGAVIFTVPSSGEIRVMLGGEGFSSKNQFNRAYQAKRQIGSTMKPFLYLSGINNKVITPYTIFEDKPVTIEVENAPEDQKYWEVKNYGEKYKGYLTATEGLYRSSNVVAAQVAYMIGIEGLREIIKEVLSLSSKDTDKRFPPYYAMALGTAEMTPYEVNSMFVALANQGEAVKPYLISKVVDNRSRVIYEAPVRQRKRVVSKEAAYLVINMMRKVLSPAGTGAGIRPAYKLNDLDLAGKTGTTQDYRDTWFNGINPALVGTVWIGQDKNKSMGRGFTGGMAAAPLWAKIMKKASEYYTLSKFTYDSSYSFVRQPVCLLSGKVPTEKSLFVEKNALFIEGTEPGEYNDLSEEELKKRALMKGWIKEEVKKDEKENKESEKGKENKTGTGQKTN